MISSPMMEVCVLNLKITAVDLALRCDEFEHKFEHKLVPEMGFEMEIENEVV